MKTFHWYKVISKSLKEHMYYVLVTEYISRMKSARCDSVGFFKHDISKSGILLNMNRNCHHASEEVNK